jgi:hypothetical protein
VRQPPRKAVPVVRLGLPLGDGGLPNPKGFGVGPSRVTAYLRSYLRRKSVTRKGLGIHLRGAPAVMGHGEWGMEKTITNYLFPNYQFPMPNARCPIPHAQCPMPLLTKYLQSLMVIRKYYFRNILCFG